MLVITVLLLGVMQGRGAVGVDKGIAPEASAAPSGNITVMPVATRKSMDCSLFCRVCLEGGLMFKYI